MGIGAGSWNRLTKSVIALFPWKRPSSIELNKEDTDDMEGAETQNGLSAFVLLGVLISDVNAQSSKANVSFLLSIGLSRTVYHCTIPLTKLFLQSPAY